MGCYIPHKAQDSPPPTPRPKNKAQLPRPTSAETEKLCSEVWITVVNEASGDVATFHTGNSAFKVTPSEAFCLPATPPLSPGSRSHLLSPTPSRARARTRVWVCEENERPLCQTLVRALSFPWGEAGDLVTKAKG